MRERDCHIRVLRQQILDQDIQNYLLCAVVSVADIVIILLPRGLQHIPEGLSQYCGEKADPDQNIGPNSPSWRNTGSIECYQRLRYHHR